MWFADYWWVIAALPAWASCILIKLIRLSQAGAYAVDRCKLWIPLDGEDSRKIDCGQNHENLGHARRLGRAHSRIARDRARDGEQRRLRALFHAGLSNRSAKATPSPIRLKQSRLVDDMVVNMIEVGEETGDLDTMLYKVADFYDEEVDTLVKGLISALEPIMIVVLGFIIGAIVISLFLPLIKLLEGLSK